VEGTLPKRHLGDFLGEASISPQVSLNVIKDLLGSVLVQPLMLPQLSQRYLQSLNDFL
jgi:hypothetical protein